MKDAQITRYTRNKKGNRNGCLVAAKMDDGTIRVGFSLCHRNDEFDKHLGKQKAVGRMNATKNYIHDLPHSMKDEYERFAKRCMKYFKA